MKMKFWNLFILIILTSGLGVLGQMPQQPKFLVINGLKEDAGYVFQEKSFEELLRQPGGIGDYDIKSMAATKSRAEKALQKIKQLIDGGTPETESIEIAGEKMTIGELSERVFEIHRDASKVVVLNQLTQHGVGSKTYVEIIASGKTKRDAFGDPLDGAKIYSDGLLKAVAEAQTLGFPEDYKINITGQDFTIAELREMAIYVSNATKQLKAEQLAALAAKDAPFLQVLTGDKARIFKSEFGGMDGQWECFGSGGTVLSTPAAMKGATVWFTYGNNRGIIDTLHITGYRFQGDKLVGRISRSGFGLKPSAGNFR